MNVVFLKNFTKDIDKLTSVKVKSDIADTIEGIERATKITDIANIKKMKGYKNAYRIRIGDYRIGIFIENSNIELVRIAHRKDIYKIFP